MTDTCPATRRSCGRRCSPVFSRRNVIGRNDSTVTAWTFRTDRETVTFEGHDAGALGVSFSPDGKRIVSGSGDKMLKVWDISSLDTSK